MANVEENSLDESELSPAPNPNAKFQQSIEEEDHVVQESPRSLQSSNAGQRPAASETESHTTPVKENQGKRQTSFEYTPKQPDYHTASKSKTINLPMSITELEAQTQKFEF